MAIAWSSISILGSLSTYVFSLKTLCIVLALVNIKSMPFMWFARFLRIFCRRLTDSAPKKHLSPRCLFLPAISTTRALALECDYNMHKSNSTYFTDMDMSRGNFCLALFSKPFNPFPGPKNFNMILGSTSCTWRKEIKPFQRYELWTRVLSWDEKWLYVVTHFVVADRFRPQEYAMQPGANAGKGKEVEQQDTLKSVFASSVARYVFKNNRRTIPPEEAMRQCGLLPDDKEKMAEVDKARLGALSIGRMEAGWDAVHASFQPVKCALGRYTSVY